MIPEKFAGLTPSTVPIYFKKQYPDTTDCILLDKHIKAIGDDIAEIDYAILSNRYEGHAPAFSGAHVRKSARDFLSNLYLHKKNLFDGADCRNKIELQRQDESASVFNQFASKSDQSVLGATVNKQVVFFLIGGVVILGALYVIVKRKR